jgi:hypothetical protein
MSLSVNSVVNLLQQEFGLEILERQPQQAIQFDAVLRSREDPMPLFVLEDISRSTDKAVTEKCRKLESFIWNLYRAGKVNTVTAIFLIGDINRNELIALSKRLSGIGRLFFVSLSLTRDETIQLLRPIIPPKLARAATNNEQLAAVAARSENVMADVTNTSLIAQWVRGRVTAEDLKNNVNSEFDRLLRDLQNAIK